MIRVDDLELFVRAAALDSFSAVGREVDLLPAQVSAAIKRLEKELDIRLFARSTRSLRLTAQGEHYLPFARDVLSTLREGLEGLRCTNEELQGVIQIASASDFGRNVLLPWLIDFRQQHPALTYRLRISDTVADVYKDPVDVAIRYGQLEDASFISLPLVPNNRRVLAASPEYLRRNGIPETLEDLTQHSCLRYHLNGRLYDKWIFPEAKAKTVITVDGPVVSDDADIIRRCAIAGEGVLYKSWLDICDDVHAGLLEIIMPEQPGELFPLNFICPHRKQFSPATKQLYAWVKQRCDALAKQMPVQ
jgi:DNA-binding transcriptional LysR family regulator